MKVNLTPLIEFFENLTIYRLFFTIVIVPTALGFLSLAFMQHKGTSYLVTHEVDVDISIGGENAGELTIGLFGKDVPKTVRNFISFAKGYEHEGKILKYEGTTFHRVIRAFMIQGGDIFKGSNDPEGLPGKGAISIYGDTFPDENFIINHAAPGFLSMANRGPDTNGCQFFITLRATTFLDGKHVVFGKVIQNQPLVHRIERLEMDKDDRPTLDVVMEKFVVRPLQKQYYISDDPYNVWDWLKTISVPLLLCLGICSIFTYFMSFLDAGIAAEEAMEALHKKQVSRKKRVDSSESEDDKAAETKVRHRGRNDSIDGAEEVTMDDDEAKSEEPEAEKDK